MKVNSQKRRNRESFLHESVVYSTTDETDIPTFLRMYILYIS